MTLNGDTADPLTTAHLRHDLAARLHDTGNDCTLLIHPGDGHSLSPAAAARSLDAELGLYRRALAL